MKFCRLSNCVWRKRGRGLTLLVKNAKLLRKRWKESRYLFVYQGNLRTCETEHYAYHDNPETL